MLVVVSKANICFPKEFFNGERYVIVVHNILCIFINKSLTTFFCNHSTSIKIIFPFIDVDLHLFHLGLVLVKDINHI
jgi:hypothetical protein